MPLPTFEFTPTQGFRDSSFAPTDPPSEAALRDTMQDIPDQLRDALNVVINTLNSTTDGSSGADNIGMTPISGLTATNPQQALEELAAKSPINVADNSITNLKLAPDVKVGSLAALLTTIKTSVVDAINELFNNKADLNNPTFTNNINLTTINNKTPSYADAPTETEITTGFESGVSSGKLFYSKTQENQLNIAIDKFITTADITTSYLLVYTLPLSPINYRPKHTQRLIGTGFTSGGALIAGTLIEVLIDTDGTIKIKSILGTTTNLRYVGGLQTTVLGV